MDNTNSAKIFLTCALIGAAIGTIARVLIRPSTRRSARSVIQNTRSHLKKMVKSKSSRRGSRKSKHHLSTSHLSVPEAKKAHTSHKKD